MPRGDAPRGGLWSMPQLPQTDHIPLGPREPRFALRSFYVSRKHKIAFCAIPKVACTEFIRLMYVVGRRSALVEGPPLPDRRLDTPETRRAKGGAPY